MANLDDHRKALIARILDGDGQSTSQQRRAAFEGTGPEAARPLVAKVANHAYKVTDEDVAAAKAAGLTEDQVFELVVCTAIGEANRQLETALAALDAASKDY